MFLFCEVKVEECNFSHRSSIFFLHGKENDPPAIFSRTHTGIKDIQLYLSFDGLVDHTNISANKDDAVIAIVDHERSRIQPRVDSGSQR